MTAQGNCKYDDEAKTYLRPDGEKCRTDEWGMPAKHCTARRTCSQHVGYGELTCARCVGRTRTDIRQIVMRYAEVMPEALESGSVDSQLAMLAGPGVDPESWSWKKAAAKQAHMLAEMTGKPTKVWHASMVEDDDERDAYRVLTTWAQMLTEDYELDRPEVWTVTNAAALLDRVLHRMAQDPEQDFTLLAREARKARAYLETVLSDSLTPERGAFCPTCKKDGTALVRLNREYAHWCTDPECSQQFHAVTDDLDVWRCPRNSEHWWTVEGFAEDERERMGA